MAKPKPKRKRSLLMKGERVTPVFSSGLSGVLAHRQSAPAEIDYAIRECALSAALELKSGPEPADYVVARARTIEAYLRGKKHGE